MKWLTILMAALLFAGCNKSTDNSSATTEPGTETEQVASLLPEKLFVDSLDDTISVIEARKLKAGDEVTLSGKVMGAESVFIDNRALMVIGDPSKLTSCDLRPGDDCPKPWDVCCDDPELIKTGTLSVQVVDKDGKVIKAGLKGKGGLKELSFVKVKGVVSADSTAESMTVNASSIVVSDKAFK